MVVVPVILELSILKPIVITAPVNNLPTRSVKSNVILELAIASVVPERVYETPFPGAPAGSDLRSIDEGIYLVA